MTLKYSFHPVTKDETKEKIVRYLEAIEIPSKIINEGLNGSLELEIGDDVDVNQILEIGSMIGMHETFFSWAEDELNDFPMEGDDDDV
jgi:hypothetical protein